MRMKLKSETIIEVKNMTIKIEDLDKIDFSDIAEPGIRPPVSVGRMLMEEFLNPLGWTKYKLAKEIGVSQSRIGEIVSGSRAVTVDTDLRLCKLFGLSDGWWLRLQLGYDIDVGKEKMKKVLAGIQPVVHS